ERDVVADLGRLADDDPGAVVDEEALADPCRRVDLDPRQHPRSHRQRARDGGDADLVQLVRDAVHEQRLDTGPRRQDLGARGAARRRVARVRGGDVAANLPEHPRERRQTDHAPETSGARLPAKWPISGRETEVYGAKNGAEM